MIGKKLRNFQEFHCEFWVYIPNDDIIPRIGLI